MPGNGITAAQMEPQYRQRNGLGELAYRRDWPKHFDYVLWIDFGERPARASESLQPVASGSFFRIYRVLRP